MDFHLCVCASDSMCDIPSFDKRYDNICRCNLYTENLWKNHQPFSATDCDFEREKINAAPFRLPFRSTMYQNGEKPTYTNDR